MGIVDDFSKWQSRGIICSMLPEYSTTGVQSQACRGVLGDIILTDRQAPLNVFGFNFLRGSGTEQGDLEYKFYERMKLKEGLEIENLVT